MCVCHLCIKELLTYLSINTDFNSSMRSTVFWVYLCVFIKILSLLLNIMLTVDKHCSDVCCDEFSVHRLIAKVNKLKNSDTEIFYFNQ